MGYMHIQNLYKDQRILLFREAYALEKIHGTSAHLQWYGDTGQVSFSSGGEKYARFVALFDEERLKAGFAALGHERITVYGKAYGGSQQGQSWRYGKALKFIAFEVKIGDLWLAVPQAEDVVKKLGLEFVHYRKVSTDLAALDAERDAPSEQSRRNGVEGDKPREGVVLRPLVEFTTNDGSRVLAKHKRDEERETASPRKVVDPATLEVLTEAEDVAMEWVTPTRLSHVLDKITPINSFREVIDAMLEDVLREGVGEIVDSRAVRAAVARRTGVLFKERLKAEMLETRKDRT